MAFFNAPVESHPLQIPVSHRFHLEKFNAIAQNLCHTSLADCEDFTEFTYLSLKCSSGLEISLANLPQTEDHDKNLPYEAKVNCSNGVFFEGKIQDGRPNGQGKFIYKQGGIYEGNFICGVMEGQGTYLEVNGNYYVGEFKENYPHGFGTFNFYHKQITYQGQMDYGIAQGKGTISHTNGYQYHGDIFNTNPHGRGKEILPNGEIYDGEFVYSARNGTGVLMTKSFTYFGGFKNNLFHGEGVIIFSNKTVYKGTFVEGCAESFLYLAYEINAWFNEYGIKTSSVFTATVLLLAPRVRREFIGI